MSHPTRTINDLLARLELEMLDADTAVGSLGDTLVTMTVLSVEPLSLLFAFTVNQESSDSVIRPESVAELSPEACRISVENGRCWLSLYEVTTLSDEQIAGLVSDVHDGLREAKLTVGPGCLHCGRLDSVQVLRIEGSTTRICQSCLDQAFTEKSEREAQQNKTSVSALLGMPAAILICAGCWALFWFAVDFVLDWSGIQMIELNQFTYMLLIALFAGTGAAVGMPLGKSLRKSGVTKIAPIPLTSVIVVGALVAGEIVYVALLIFQKFGIVDFTVAAQLLWPVVSGYTPFWMASKTLCAAAVAGFCIHEAAQRSTSRLNV